MTLMSAADGGARRKTGNQKCEQTKDGSRHGLLRGVDARLARSPRILPIAWCKRLAGGQDFDPEDAALRIDVVDERPRFFLMIDRAAADRQIDGVSFRIVGHIDHGFRLAFRSNITLITRMASSVSSRTARKMRPPKSSIRRNRRSSRASFGSGCPIGLRAVPSIHSSLMFRCPCPDLCMQPSVAAASAIDDHTSTFSAAMNASCGMSTFPYWRIFFLPSFCLSRSLRLRVTSPP